MQLRGHLANLRTRLFQYISDVLDTETMQQQLSSPVPTAASRWARVRQRFVSLFSTVVGQGGVDSKDEVSSALMDLNEEIMGQVRDDTATISSMLRVLHALAC